MQGVGAGAAEKAGPDKANTKAIKLDFMGMLL
jgi:hypothetical protein